MKLTKGIIYDIEVMPKVFLVTCLDISTGTIRVFEVSKRRNDYFDFRRCLDDLKARDYFMVGFNNFFYDYPVVHSLLFDLELDPDLSWQDVTTKAWSKSKEVISSSMRYENVVWEKNQYLFQIDLYRLHHFDNKAKTVSLKRLEFNMRRKNVLEFTEGFDRDIEEDEEFEKLIAYNKEDVIVTYHFWCFSQEALHFRESLVPKFGLPVLNYNDTKIGEQLIKIELSRGDVWVDFSKKTYRDKIPLNEVIFPDLRFVQKEGKDLLARLRNMTVFVEGGERFEWSSSSFYRENKARIAALKETVKTLGARGKNDPDYLEAKANLKELSERFCDETVSCSLGGVSFDLGKGGLHAATSWGVFRKDDWPGWKIKDVDVTSFYPTIAIEYGMKPEHLPDAYLSFYSWMKTERLKHPKKSPINMMYKLALNGTFGKTKSVYSFLYDPKYALQTVINGQLMLLMLWDMLTERLEPERDIVFIQANTDGMTYLVREEKEEVEKDLCSSWEKKTRMSLECVEYESMFVRDVNNYVARDVKGNVKLKGDYNYKELFDGDLGQSANVLWYKDHGGMIIKKAAVSFLLDKVPIEDYISNHKDIYDFFFCTNVSRSSELYLDEERIQRNSRILVTRGGAELYKVMPPLKGKREKRWSSIFSGRTVEVCNDLNGKEEERRDIDYDFYIEQTKELVRGFENV